MVTRKTILSTAAVLGAIFLVSQMAIPSAQAQTAQVTLTIKTVYADGTTLTGMWTTLRDASTNALIASGFSPINFSLQPNKAYKVSVGNYNGITFHHWQDSGSTTASRTVSINQALTLTAVYNSPAPVAGSFSVDTKKDATGKQTVVFYMTGKQNSNQVYRPIFDNADGCPDYGDGIFDQVSGYVRWQAHNNTFVGTDCLKYQVVDKNTLQPLSNVGTVTIRITGQ